ncbi:unnamed protein product [Cyprideis torosa]|uniref:Uncharacterized protein n=1 Tax=Cyprideis torosa TaxID=163714 RepID=A0A7R8W0D9_9CRUS|nr:unnamed protein product [Cyprideis torosa]CAG0879648.1 unnamed protein product [Cyprideis torosa]
MPHVEDLDVEDLDVDDLDLEDLDVEDLAEEPNDQVPPRSESQIPSKQYLKILSLALSGAGPFKARSSVDHLRLFFHQEDPLPSSMVAISRSQTVVLLTQRDSASPGREKRRFGRAASTRLATLKRSSGSRIDIATANCHMGRRGLTYGLQQARLRRRESPTPQELIATGKRAMDEFLRLKDREDWVHLQKDEVTGAQLYFLNHTAEDEGQREIYKVEYVVHSPPEVQYRELQFGFDNVASWNPTVLVSKVVQKLDLRTIVGYQVRTPMSGLGFAPPRSFLGVRRTQIAPMESKQLAYHIAYVGVDYDEPTINQLTENPVPRATIYPSGLRIEPHESNPLWSKTTWISSVDLHYDDVPVEVQKLFQQFNLILAAELQKQHIERLPKKEWLKKSKT